jgi:biopolymer transport protein ExbD
VIRADEKLDYGLIVKIMGIVNAAEITDISIAVK